MTDCLPSIITTVESVFNYKVYNGTESYDFQATQFDEVKSMSAGNIEIIPMIVKGGKINIVINELAHKAYRYGVEYMCRIDDDTQFITKNWTFVYKPDILLSIYLSIYLSAFILTSTHLSMYLGYWFHFLSFIQKRR